MTTAKTGHYGPEWVSPDTPLPIPESSQPYLLQAGDQILVAFRDHLTEKDAAELGQALEEAFPRIGFWLLDGVGSVLLHRPTG